MKELLAPSNPYKSNKLEGEGCYKCDAKRCDSCKNFLNFGNSFRAAATGRIFLILKSLTCTSSNVVYLAECVLCGLQGSQQFIATLTSLQPSLPSWSFERSTYETLRMLGCIDDVPVLSHMRLVRALARGYIRVIMYLGMYKAALMRRKRRNMHVCR